MDETRFDDLTRILAGHGSRRSLLRIVFAAGAAGVTTRFSRTEQVAAKRRKRGSCTSIDDCHPCQRCQIAAGQSKGKCVPVADGSDCGGDCGVCQGGHCRPDSTLCDDCQTCDAKSFVCRPQCPAGKLCCGLDCCDSDQNCCNDVCCNTGCSIGTGECCPEDKFCAGHLCCDADEVCCGGECVLACDNGCDHDPDDCACGYAPHGMAFCPSLGLCRSTKCPRGQTFDPSTCRCECKHGAACGDKCCAGRECCNGQCCDHACASDGSCSDCASGVRCNGHCLNSTDVCCNDGCWPAEFAPYTPCGTTAICCPTGTHCCYDDTGCCED